MQLNIGNRQRAVRIALGLALIAGALLGPAAVAAVGWLGVVPLVAGMIGWCPFKAASRRFSKSAKRFTDEKRG